MLFSVSTVRRAAVVLAVGCATALTATAASAAPTTPAHSARPAVIPTCARDNLKFHVSQGSGAAGTFTYLLRFTNTSRRTCYLFGFPGVRAVNRHGRQLGSPAAWVAGRRCGWSPCGVAGPGTRCCGSPMPPSSRTGCAGRPGPAACGSSRRAG